MARRSSSDQVEAPSFGTLYAEHAQGLLAFFVRRTYDVEVSRDLTAETFALALEGRHQLRGRSDTEVSGWLYGIGRHQLNRYIRRGIAERKAITRLGIRLPQVSASDYERIVELAGVAELRGAVADAFGVLPKNQRSAITLRVVDERPYPEVAATLGISEQAARARVSRGLRRLTETLDSKPRAEVAS